MELVPIDLRNLGISIKSFPDEGQIFLVPVDEINVSTLNDMLTLNELECHVSIISEGMGHGSKAS